MHISNVGYKMLGHARPEHREIAKKVLGGALPKGVQVHHVDGNKLNNTNNNLVICPDRAYHALLHRRQDAVNAGYPANYMRCPFCQKYDDPQNMAVRLILNGKSERAHHRQCFNKYQKKWRKRK